MKTVKPFSFLSKKPKKKISNNKKNPKAKTITWIRNKKHKKRKKKKVMQEKGINFNFTFLILQQPAWNECTTTIKAMYNMKKKQHTQKKSNTENKKEFFEVCRKKT